MIEIFGAIVLLLIVVCFALSTVTLSYRVRNLERERDGLFMPPVQFESEMLDHMEDHHGISYVQKSETETGP